ncbi:peptidoglycan DD-metalloendopeptidase family protein [uncultured Brevundimonas sp.]|uniref:M23 family metallopeptidase n=1 Tax=uncultured Brevundimonas sp. TaxID=213418 RepID=UPI0030EF8FDB|tara:strand:- start:6027 stop:6857 length:831 start_codon:yes stop_codon:yes gene_type:complete
MTASRRGLLIGGTAAMVAGPVLARAEDSLSLSGAFVQGGHAIGRTWPGALIFVDGEALTTASADGVFIVGFDRDQSGSVEVRARAPSGESRRVIDIAPVTFPSTRVDGLPSTTITPSDPVLLARIRREVELKTEGFASRTDADHFRDGFVWPLETFRISSRWGSQRILNGTPARPHYGIDLAAPRGTPIRAPAAGLVTLSQPDLHFEGGLVLLDHGQGLITAYLHQSRIDVQAGQTVRRGDIIGRVGMTGRATGPHLCWRMKWRDRNLDPSLLVRA